MRQYSSKSTFLFRRIGVLVLTCLSAYSCALLPGNSISKRGEKQAGNQISAEVTTHLGDKATFIKGDEIQFLLSLSQNSYVLLLYQDASKHLWQLFPNRMRPEQRLPAGDYQSFPSNDDGIKITVGPPYGKEQILLYASDKPLPELEFIKSANGMRLLKEDLTAIQNQITAASKIHQAKLAQASTTIKTSDH